MQWYIMSKERCKERSRERCEEHRQDHLEDDTGSLGGTLTGLISPDSNLGCTTYMAMVNTQQTHNLNDPLLRKKRKKSFRDVLSLVPSTQECTQKRCGQKTVY